VIGSKYFRAAGNSFPAVFDEAGPRRLHHKNAAEKIIYCHTNPVVRKLAGEPDEWRWLRFNWYASQANVQLAMDEVCQFD